MKEIKFTCPCCGKEILLSIKDDCEKPVVFFDINDKFGIELGVVKGGEIENE